MPYLLAIETALEVCSVALSNGKDIMALKEEKGHNIHSSRLTVLIGELLKESGIKIKDLDAIIVSKGPGSFTGLRIGVSVAKGLAYTLDIPLIGVNTLQGLAKMALNNPQLKVGDSAFVPMIDARRMEVYWAVYDRDMKEILPTKASIIDEEFIKQFPRGKQIVFFGNGMEKCREILALNPNAIFLQNIEPSALPLIDFGIGKYNKNEFEDVSSFEPFYLKDFFTTAKG
jgi:tRNA threonylcarbamoyladenosine biosynthesis protein TsaB